MKDNIEFSSHYVLNTKYLTVERSKIFYLVDLDEDENCFEIDGICAEILSLLHSTQSKGLSLEELASAVLAVNPDFAKDEFNELFLNFVRDLIQNDIISPIADKLK